MINFCCKPNIIKQIFETFNDFYHFDELHIKEIQKRLDDYENSEMNKNNISTISTEKTFSTTK